MQNQPILVIGPTGKTSARVATEDLHASVTQAGSDFVVDLLAAIARDTLGVRTAQLIEGVQHALGRPPRGFSAFAQTAAQSGAWTQAA